MTTKPQPHRQTRAAPYVIPPGPGAAPDDDEPLPDAMYQEPFYTETLHVIRTYFWGRADMLISGDSSMYYRDPQGRQQFVKPDCYIAFGVNEKAIRERNGYFIEEVGKPPDFALEIASESTYENDIGPKRELYARLGIEEYWRFDGSGGLYYGAGLAGDRLEDGEYRPIEVVRDANGVVRGYSPRLGLELCWDDGKLRFYDPVAGEYLRNLPEAEADRLAERAARQAAESENLRLREQLRRLQEQQSTSDSNNDGDSNNDSLPEGGTRP